MRKSPIKTSKSISPRKQRQNIPQKSPQVQKIIAIKDNFRKNIETPIQHIESIVNSLSPQRCLLHNTVLTLYCEIDRKTLCASCMYQQETHRKHRVIPLGRAMHLVKEDVSAFQYKLQANLNQCSAMSRKLQQMIIKNERYYPSVINQLKKFYTGMHEMLREKQKEQISQITQIQQKIKTQVLSLDQQIKKISSVIIYRLKPQKKQTEDSCIVRRQMLEVLIKVNKIINQDISTVFDDDESKNIIDFNFYDQVCDMVKKNLILVLPGISIKPRRSLYSSSSTHAIVPVPQKKSLSVKVVSAKVSPQKLRDTSKNKKQRKGVTFDLG